MVDLFFVAKLGILIPLRKFSALKMINHPFFQNVIEYSILFSYFCSVNSYPPLLSPLSAAPLLSGRPASRYDDGILSSRIQLDIKQQ